MADVFMGAGPVSTKQDLVAALIQKELAFQAKLLPTVLNVSQYAVPGAKSISFPKFDSFTVINRASGAAGPATALTSSNDQMLLNKNGYVAWGIDSSDSAQWAVNAEAEAIKRASGALARYVDTSVIAELETAGDATATAGALTRDIFLEMRQTLLSRHANPDLLTMVVGPDSETLLLKISQFSDAQVYGLPVVPGGVIAQIYGVKIMMHTGLGANTFYMYEQNGLAVGFQKSPQMSDQPDNQYGSGGRRYAMDLLFGVKGLEIAQAGAGAGESALIVKDGN